MVSAISNYNTPINSIMNIQKNVSITPIADEMKKTASIANSYYSLSDRVEAIKTETKDDSSWLYKKVNELGVPAGLNIEGFDDTSQNIVVNIMSSDLTKLTSEPRVTLQDLKGENQDKKLDSMDLNNDGQITTDEVAQFMALQMAQAAEETIEENISIKDEEKETSLSDDIENIAAEREDKSISTLLHSYKSGINSYKENVKLYQNYLNDSKSYLI